MKEHFHRCYVHCENTNTNLNIMYGKGERAGSGGRSLPSAVCMYVTITMNYIMM